jgi:hypothetical protein
MYINIYEIVGMLLILDILSEDDIVSLLKNNMKYIINNKYFYLVDVAGDATP